MRCKTLVLALFCAGTAVLLNAADIPAAQDKAAGEAAAVANGEVYNTAKIAFDSILKSNKLEHAFAAAKAMLASAEKPGKGAWRNTAQTYDYLAKAFSDKKIYGRKQAIALYEEAIASLAGDDQADLLLKYGYYLNAFALADEAKANAYVDQAFQIPGVTDAKKIALCKAAAQLDNWKTLDPWTAKAMAYARDDVKLQAGIQQWRLSANIREQDLDALCAAYDAYIADAKYADFIHGSNGPFRDYVSELSRRKQYARALDLLAKAPGNLPPDALLAYRKLTAEIHQKAAERYYDSPDPVDLKLAIGMYETIIADIPTNKLRDTVPFKVSIAELAHQAGDVQQARDMANAVLQLNNNPLTSEYHRMQVLLGRIAYDAEDYATAAAILEAAYASIREKPGNFPRRRELVEMLVRSLCASGETAKSATYADDLLAVVKDHEKRRYQIYVDGLKSRASPPAK
jgi:hypothetical protein